jgi:hypothetical protein
VGLVWYRFYLSVCRCVARAVVTGCGGGYLSKGGSVEEGGRGTIEGGQSRQSVATTGKWVVVGLCGGSWWMPVPLRFSAPSGCPQAVLQSDMLVDCDLIHG